MTQQLVPTPNFSRPIVDGQGMATRAFAAFINYAFARLGGTTDKIDAAFQTAASAAPASRQVVGAGGLQGGSSLAGDIGLALYAAMTTVASLPTAGLAEGDFAYALDGCKTGESTGAGTGVPVWWSNDGWYAVDSGAVVAA